MAELDITTYEEVSRLTRGIDRTSKGGLNPDSVRRIANGSRTGLQERTLDLLAGALHMPKPQLRALANSAPTTTTNEFVPPPEAHHTAVTARLRNAWTEMIRASVDAVNVSYQDGYQAGFAAASAENVDSESDSLAAVD